MRVSQKVHYFCALAALCLCAILPTRARGLDLRWLAPESSHRGVFTITDTPASKYVLITIPHAPISGLAAYNPKATQLTHTVALATESATHVLVSVGRRGVPGQYELYFSLGDVEHEDSSASSDTDPRPVTLSTYPRASGNPPPGVIEMLALRDRYRSDEKYVKSVPHFGAHVLPRPAQPEGRHRHSHRRQANLIRAHALLRCEKAGYYRFAIKSKDAGFALLDQVPVAEWPGIHPADAWKAGQQIYLNPGLYQLELYNWAQTYSTAFIHWQPPDAPRMQAIPQEYLMPSAQPVLTTVEDMGTPLSAAFSVTPGRSYRFRNSARLFTPVTLIDTSHSRLSESFTAEWALSGNPARLAGRRVQTVLTGDRAHTIRLTVRDRLGFTATAEQTVRHGADAPLECAYAAHLQGVPAVLTHGMHLQPKIHVQTSEIPGSHPLALHWSLTYTNGATSSGTATCTVSTNQHAVALLPRPAPVDGLARIDWSIEHEGITLSHESLRVLRTPFDTVPSATVNNALYAPDGVRLAFLVPDPHDADHQPRISQDEAFGHVLCLDDILAPRGWPLGNPGAIYDRILARIVDGPNQPIVSRRTPPAADQTPSSRAAMEQLLFAISTANELQPDVVVLSLVGSDIMRATRPADFEMHAAAMTDLLRATGTKVLWTTPPATGSTANEVRPYALAIQRVAQARHIPVADLFSASSGARRLTDFVESVDTMTLSPNGHDLSAQLIARALLNH